MISTPMEEKWRAFIYDHMSLSTGHYEDLDILKKVYADRPRNDVKRDDFPRLQVKELPSPSDVVHRTSMREYAANLSLIVYVDMDTTLTIDGSTASPEVACAQIGYLIIDNINTYWETGLFKDEEMYVRTLTYNRMGIDNEYFNNLNVYKGSVEVSGIYWR